MRRLIAALIVCGAGALMTGCFGSDGPAPTPQRFTEREPLPSCGELTLGSDEPVPDENLACLGAAGDEGAELSVTRPTVEGDPVTEYYRVLPGGGWEAYIDGSQDRYGGDWWFTDCPDAVSISDLAECEGVVL